MSFIAGFFASLGAFLRIVGFMHWTTDVLTGVFVGSMCGTGLPMIVFKIKNNKERIETINPFLDESVLVDSSTSSSALEVQ